jgi:hypothetical protein
MGRPFHRRCLLHLPRHPPTPIRCLLSLSPFVVAHSLSPIRYLNLQRVAHSSSPIHCYLPRHPPTPIRCLLSLSPFVVAYSLSHNNLERLWPIHRHPIVVTSIRCRLPLSTSPSATSSTPPIRCRPFVVAHSMSPSIVSVCHVIHLFVVSPSATSSPPIHLFVVVSFRRVFLCHVVICLRLHVGLEVKGPGRFNARWRTTSNCECTLRQTWYRPFMEIRRTGGKSYFPGEEEYQDSF